MESWKGKHFSITDPKGVKTVIYEVYKTNKEYLDRYPKYTVERLRSTETYVGDLKRKTFYVEDPQDKRKSTNNLFFCKRKGNY